MYFCSIILYLSSNMNDGRVILKTQVFHITLERLCRQLIEGHGSFDNTCLIGIQPRGTLLSDRIFHRIVELSSNQDIDYGKLDITFYRDDFRRRETPLKASETEMNFIIEGKKVVLIDDVLYSGRTIQAALNALQHYGRPAKIELLTLVNRRFDRHVPVQPDYVGITVDAVDRAYVKVEWEEQDGADSVRIYSEKSALKITDESGT